MPQYRKAGTPPDPHRYDICTRCAEELYEEVLEQAVKAALQHHNQNYNTSSSSQLVAGNIVAAKRVIDASDLCDGCRQSTLIATGSALDQGMET